MASNTAKSGREKAGHLIELMYTDDFLNQEVDGMKNKERMAELYLKSVKSLPPFNQKGMISQVMAVQTHKVGPDRLMKLKESGIPILISTGDTDKLVNPKASLFLKSVCNDEWKKKECVF